MEQFSFLNIRECNPTRYEVNYLDGTTYQVCPTREKALEVVATFHSEQCQKLMISLERLQNQVKDAGLWWNLSKAGSIKGNLHTALNLLETGSTGGCEHYLNKALEVFSNDK
jgi:hypothetical protein